jgi:molecular chaperone DnaJ
MLEVPTLEGMVRMKLPPGTQSGKVFRLRGKGIPVYGGYGKGDELITVVVEVPEKISRRQKKLIAELADEMDDEALPQQQRFFEKIKSLFG